MENITNQHDKYFKEIFSRKEEMIDFITNALPQISKYLDLSTLQLDPTQNIDKKLQVGYSDSNGKLYRIPSKKALKEIKLKLRKEVRQNLGAKPHDLI